jgi:hypothetical protein
VTDDPVQAVVLAFLDHLEGLAPRPTLDHLEPDDRARAQELLDGLVVARGIDPRASRPSVESLLMGTPLSGLLPALNPVGNADVTTVARVLAGVDPRARAEIRPDGTVAYSYLDLHARFLLVPTENPLVSEQVRTQVRALFEADPDTSRVGVVAAGSHDLVTQLLAADEVGHSITTPRGEPHTRWEPTLPLALAARRMLEQSAPEWPSFDFDQAHSEPLDLTAVAGRGRPPRHRTGSRALLPGRQAAGVQGTGRPRATVRGTRRARLHPRRRSGSHDGDHPHHPGGSMIRRLHLQGWRAFDDLTLELSDGLTFVVAENGVGKTSLVQAAAWGLYGGLSNVDARAAARVGAARTRVEVDLELPDGRLLAIAREVVERGETLSAELDGGQLDEAGLAAYWRRPSARRASSSA